MLYFKNDYNALGSDEIIKNIVKFKDEDNLGYGEDYHTKEAINLIRKEISDKYADIYFLSGGTITNRIGLYQMLRPYEAVICVESGHINVHETGAIESTGHKVLTVKGINGKVDINEVEEVLKNHTDSHKVLIRAIYISQSTEIGTIYSKEEIINLYKFCKKNDLYLFIDGARLGVALECDICDFTMKDIAKYCDMFYIGGTKNGAPLGEALVIVNDELKKNFAYLLKNQGGLLAKGYLCGIIFETLFTDSLYYRNAKNSIDKALKLREVFNKHKIVEEYVNPTNQIFVRLNKDLYNNLSKEVLFEIWEEKDNYIIARFVTNYKTTDLDIKNFDLLLSKMNHL